MAAAIASRAGASQAAFAGKATRRANVAKRMVCRAENKSVAKVDRSKDLLYFSSESTLKYLDGTLPGDFGFDPLGLLDPVDAGGFINPQWLQYSEIIHCRWAMLGAAGCIAPEILGAWGVIPAENNIAWFKSGVIPPAGTYDNYWTDPYSLFLIEIIAIQFAELKRLQDYKYPGSQAKQYFLGIEKVFGGSGNPAYPGGQFFNMFNLGATEAEMNKYKLNEVRNGRLAMLAMWGYGAQAVMTHEGPYANLCAHLADPLGNNILTNFAKSIGSL